MNQRLSLLAKPVKKMAAALRSCFTLSASLGSRVSRGSCMFSSTLQVPAVTGQTPAGDERKRMLSCCMEVKALTVDLSLVECLAALVYCQLCLLSNSVVAAI